MGQYLSLGGKRLPVYGDAVRSGVRESPSGLYTSRAIVGDTTKSKLLWGEKRRESIRKTYLHDS